MGSIIRLKPSIELVFGQEQRSKSLYEERTFNVPTGVVSISIEVEAEQQMWLTSMVYDEQGELRAQFMNIHTPGPVVIHQEKGKSSPYTIYGSINEGTWTINMAVVAAETVDASLDWCKCKIYFNRNEDSIEADACFWQNPEQVVFDLTGFDREKVINPESGWYKGDFHTHTIYSDGKMTREGNMVSAKNQQLDFFVATDHNLVPTSWFDETEILVIPGVEVTAPMGHYNILCANTSPFSNHKMTDLLTEEGMNNIIKDDYGSGLVSINHPFLTQWKWLFEETPLETIDCIEICNDPTYPDNNYATELALKAWNFLLNDGYAITGIGGSDSHMKPEESYEGSCQPSLIGDPGTFVYCDQLTAAEVLRRVKKGNVTVSRGERIQFEVEDCLPGDYCRLVKGVAKARVHMNEEIYFEWVLDGQIVKRERGNESEYEFGFSDNSEYHWIRVDVRYSDGSFYGFSNPVYFNHKEPSMKNWGELLNLMEERCDD